MIGQLRAVLNRWAYVRSAGELVDLLALNREGAGNTVAAKFTELRHAFFSGIYFATTPRNERDES